MVENMKKMIVYIVAEEGTWEGCIIHGVFREKKDAEKCATLVNTNWEIAEIELNEMPKEKK